VLVLTLAAALSAGAQSAAQGQAPPKAPQPAFTPAWEALIGEWEGAGSGKPGSGEGQFSFRLELDGKILVRRNHNEMVASNTQLSAIHDDLLVVYPIERPGEWRAFYADNEGHVIQYRARWTADGKRVTFLSDVTTGQPRYKLTYYVVSADQLEIGFETAAPGNPAAQPANVLQASRNGSSCPGNGTQEPVE
jgi:hypothetical protein